MMTEIATRVGLGYVASVVLLTVVVSVL